MSRSLSHRHCAVGISWCLLASLLVGPADAAEAAKPEAAKPEAAKPEAAKPAGEPVRVAVASKPSGLPFFIDGILQAAATPAFVELTPGEHTLTIKLEGVPPVSKTITVEAGKAAYVSLDLTGRAPAALPPETTKAPAEAPSDLDEDPEAEAKQKAQPGGGAWMGIAGWISVGLGVAGIATGVVYGMKAQDTADASKTLGPFDDKKRSGLQSDLDSQQSLQTVGYSAAGAFAIAGTLLLLLQPDDEPAPAVSVAPSPGGAMAVFRW